MKTIILMTTLLALSLSSFAAMNKSESSESGGEGTISFGNAAPDLNIIPTETIDDSGVKVSEDMVCFQAGKVISKPTSECEVKLHFESKRVIEEGEKILAKLDAGENLTASYINKINRIVPLGFTKKSITALDSMIYSLPTTYDAKVYNEAFRKLANEFINDKAYAVRYESDEYKPLVCATTTGEAIMSEAFVGQKVFYSEPIYTLELAEQMCNTANAQL